MATTESAARTRARLEARVSHEQKALFERAAALQGRSLTDFVIQSTQAAAEEVLRTHAIIKLNEQDAARLIEALLNPPEPNEALRRAFRRHDELVEMRP